MSNKYKMEDRVPSDIICKRLDELSRAIARGRECFNREFTMRVPAEKDHDADLVIAEASRRIRELESANNRTT